MEWQQFEYFRTLAQMEHVTKAAEALSITQPALSRSIARFEEEIGAPLFERQGRSIKLNKYGRLFLKHVDSMMLEFELGKRAIHELLEPGRGTVSFGFLHTLSTNLIPDLIAAFRSEFPAINIALKQNPSHSLLEDMQKGELDFCLISPVEIHTPIAWSKLFSEQLFVYVPKAHNLAQSNSIRLVQLINEPFILLKKGYAMRILTEAMFKEAGIQPLIAFEGDEPDTIAGLVAAGLGISILPDMKDTSLNHLVKIPIDPPDYERIIALAWVDGRYLSPASIQFKNFIFDFFST
ncbi:LysR family transcriptional regulator [Niallia sp. BSM11]|uniref:LysR family transcriptional regulator n=1 Tax=Niallia sp. BSM11 TaxID=3391576 RepID=UPI00398518BE